MQLLDASGEPLLVRNAFKCCVSSLKGAKYSGCLPFAHTPAKFPSQSDSDVCDGEKRFDPSRLKPLDPQKLCGEVMIGALIGASHWGLKAHPGHVSFGSRALSTLPQNAPPPHPNPPTYTKASQGGGGRIRGPHFRFESRRLNILHPPRQLRRRCLNDEEKEALSPIKS